MVYNENVAATWMTTSLFSFWKLISVKAFFVDVKDGLSDKVNL